MERIVIDSQHNQIAWMLITVGMVIKKHSCKICVVNMKANWQGYRTIICWYFIFCYLSCYITVAENYPTVEKSALVYCCTQCPFSWPPWWWNVHFVQRNTSASKLWQQLYRYIITGLGLPELDLWCTVFMEQNSLVLSLQPTGAEDWIVLIKVAHW